MAKRNLRKLYLDVETTGLDFDLLQVVEIAYAIDDGPVKSLIPMHTLDENGRPRDAHDAALKVNHYFERGLNDQTKWATFAEEDAFFDEITSEQFLLVGANPRFDARALEAGGFIATEPWFYRLFDIENWAAGIMGWDEPMGMRDMYEVLRDLGYTLPEPDHTAAGDVESLRTIHKIFREMQGGRERQKSVLHLN